MDWIIAVIAISLSLRETQQIGSIPTKIHWKDPIAADVLVLGNTSGGVTNLLGSSQYPDQGLGISHRLGKMLFLRSNLLLVFSSKKGRVISVMTCGARDTMMTQSCQSVSPI